MEIKQKIEEILGIENKNQNLKQENELPIVDIKLEKVEDINIMNNNNL